MRNVIRPFNARMSVGLKPTIREVCSDRDIVVIFFDATGTAGDGKPYTNTYFWLFEMYDGKVTKASAMFDSIEFNNFCASTVRCCCSRNRRYNHLRGNPGSSVKNAQCNWVGPIRPA
jgi:hypothetical protein